MNPVTFLAISSIESEGVPTKVNGGAYGIIQCSQWILTPYNCNHNTSYQLSDLIGKGPTVTTQQGALERSFDILGQFMIGFNRHFNSFRMTATAWNGCACGQDGTLSVFGSGCNPINKPANWSCYGQAAFDIASSYPDWWIDPSTGTPNSFYFGDLQAPMGPFNPYGSVTVNLG